MGMNGTYTSENGDFVLNIADADSTQSTFGGTYTAKYTPQQEQQFGVTGKWFYVGDATGPLSLGFTSFDRPEGWPYCIMDSWSGIHTSEGHLHMTGTRSYLTSDGSVQELSSLGTHSFSK